MNGSYVHLTDIWSLPSFTRCPSHDLSLFRECFKSPVSKKREPHLCRGTEAATPWTLVGSSHRSISPISIQGHSYSADFCLTFIVRCPPQHLAATFYRALPFSMCCNLLRKTRYMPIFLVSSSLANTFFCHVRFSHEGRLPASSASLASSRAASVAFPAERYTSTACKGSPFCKSLLVCRANKASICGKSCRSANSTALIFFGALSEPPASFSRGVPRSVNPAYSYFSLSSSKLYMY